MSWEEKGYFKIRPSQAGKGVQDKPKRELFNNKPQKLKQLTTLLQQIRPDLATVDKN